MKTSYWYNLKVVIIKGRIYVVIRKGYKSLVCAVKDHLWITLFRRDTYAIERCFLRHGCRRRFRSGVRHQRPFHLHGAPVGSLFVPS